MCAGCGRDLAGAADGGMVRRQVTEIPPVKAEVTEHQMIGRRARCGQATRAQAPDGVNAPVQYGPRAGGAGGVPVARAVPVAGPGLRRLWARCSAAQPSPAAVAAMARKIAALSARRWRRSCRRVTASQVAHFDETGFRVAGKLAWVHSASAGKFVLVTVHARARDRGDGRRRGAAVFAGIAVHDAWAPYDTYDGIAGHALCGAHALRELAAVTETGTDRRRDLGHRRPTDALLELKQRCRTPPAPARHPAASTRKACATHGT